jgi:hypothetical protein
MSEYNTSTNVADEKIGLIQVQRFKTKELVVSCAKKRA